MIRPARALSLVLLASCASPTTSTVADAGFGGAGGTGGSATTAGTGGGGGSAPFDSGVPIEVDAGQCAPFAATFTPVCLACLAASCCDVALACFNVSDCFGYTSCQQNCPPTGPDGGGNSCLDACTQSYPMAQPAFGSMTACLQQSCSGTCPY